MDRVKKVCSEHYKLNREQSFNDSLPVRLLTNALAAQDSDEANKIENVDWEDVFQVHEMQETDSWPSQPSDFKYNNSTILLPLEWHNRIQFKRLHKYA